MKKTYVTCDVCGCRVDYVDSDWDHNISGFTFEEQISREDSRFPKDASASYEHSVPTAVNVRPKFHYRTSGGFGGNSVPSLYLENVCSPVCLRTAVTRWLDKIDEKIMRNWKMSKEIPNEVPLGDPPDKFNA